MGSLDLLMISATLLRAARSRRVTTVCPSVQLLSSEISAKRPEFDVNAPPPKHRLSAATVATCAAQRDGRSPITPAWERMRRTFFGEMDNRAATREILRPSRFHTLGITMAANSSLICWNVLSPTIPCDH